MATSKETIQLLLEARDRASRTLTGVNKKLGGLRKTASALKGPLLAMGTAVAGSVFQFGRLGDEVQKMASRTGFSTESLSELRFALEQSGTSLQGFEVAVTRMSRVLGDAKDGTATAVDALETLGLTVEDFAGKSPEESFFLLANGIAEIEDPLVKAAVAQDVFGKSGTQLLPLLEQGAEGMAALRQEARDLGIVMDAETANKAAKMNDAINSAKQVMNGMAISIGSTVAPIVSFLGETFAALPGPLQKIVAGIVAVALAMKVGLIPSIKLTSITIRGALIASGIGLAIVAVALLITHFDEAKKVFNAVVEVLKTGATTIKDFVVGAFNTVLDFLKNNWPEIATLISGPFAPIVLLATDAFGIRSAIGNAFNDIIEFAKGTVDKIVDFFMGLPQRLAGIGKGIANAIIDSLNVGLQIINDIIPDKISIPFFPDIDLPDNPLPLIPRLARGGVVTRPMLAMIGESGPEAVIPLGRGASGAGISITINALDPQSAADAVLSVLTELERTGRMQTVTV